MAASFRHWLFSSLSLTHERGFQVQSSNILIIYNSSPLILAASGSDIIESIYPIPSGVVAEPLVTLVLVLVINDCRHFKCPSFIL